MALLLFQSQPHSHNWPLVMATTLTCPTLKSDTSVSVSTGCSELLEVLVPLPSWYSRFLPTATRLPVSSSATEKSRPSSTRPVPDQNRPSGATGPAAPPANTVETPAPSRLLPLKPQTYRSPRPVTKNAAALVLLARGVLMRLTR